MSGRTSRNPLYFDWVAVPGTPGGRIAMIPLPGRRMPGRPDNPWNRDMDDDMDAIREWGAAALVSLVQTDELVRYGVSDIAARVPRGIQRFHLPIEDCCAPGPAWDESWRRDGPAVRRLLAEGRRVVVHCLGGLGRSGTVAARILVEFGMEPNDAIAAVRAARPGAIETPEQEAYVRAVMRPAGPNR